MVSRTAKVALGGAAAACLAVVAAPAAQADTMVYVKNGYVYVANPDGSGARTVTPQSQWWAWPSETDNGTIAVAGGASRIDGGFNPSGSDQIFEFSQQGKQLSGPVATQGSYSQPNDPEYVTHFRVAPDNSYVAWTTLPSFTDAYTSWRKPDGSDSFHSANDSGGAPLPYSRPEWWGSAHLLITHDGVTIGNQAEYAMYSLADGSAPGWYDDQAIGNSSSFQEAISRDGLKFAVMTDDAPDNGGTVHNVAIHMETTATPPSNPSDVTPTGCTITLPASQFATVNTTYLASMSFSSDGTTLAWGQDDGIYEANVSDPSNCGQITSSVHLVVPGGAMPFLSPAALSAVQPGPGPNPNPGPTPGPTCASRGASACPHPPAAPNTRVTGFALSTRKHTATVHFTGSGSGRLSFQCKLDRGGWHACRSPLTLRRLKRGRHTLAVRARDASGRTDPTPATRTFRVR